ncbi:MAG: PaaI family thioesterase [Proteobacteria bacterium]|nr:PaaI family thioesterase [Pseudomonadota bacterium]MBU1742768.1 PaaI family thioesterase [Pseudomonadota bacterium]
MSDIPSGFEPLDWDSPYIHHAGPVYLRRDERGMTFGLRVEKKHTNRRGIAHGALILLLADVALGFATAFGRQPFVPVLTASLSADFAGAANLGDWIEARVDVQKVGARLAFANTYVTLGPTRLARVSAVLTVGNAQEGWD